MKTLVGNSSIKSVIQHSRTHSGHVATWLPENSTIIDFGQITRNETFKLTICGCLDLFFGSSITVSGRIFSLLVILSHMLPKPSNETLKFSLSSMPTIIAFTHTPNLSRPSILSPTLKEFISQSKSLCLKFLTAEYGSKYTEYFLCQSVNTSLRERNPGYKTRATSQRSANHNAEAINITHTSLLA